MEKRKKKVTQTVWAHWKNVYLKNKWNFLVITIFYSLALYADAIFKPTQYKAIFDLLANKGFDWTPFYYIVIALCFAWVLNRIGDFLVVFVEAKTIKDFKNYSMNNLLRKGASFFTETTSGGLVAKSRRFSHVSESIIDEFVYSINKSILLVIFIITYISFVIPEIVWIFIIWVIVFSTTTILLSMIREKYDLISSEADSAVTSKMSDIFLSIFTIRVFSSVQRTVNKYSELTRQDELKRRKSWYFGNFQWLIQSALVITLEILCMSFVIKEVIKGTHTLGTAVLVQSYIASLTAYMWGLGRSVVKVRTAFAEAYELSELMNHPEEEPIDDTQKVILEKNSIKFDRVSFNYSKNEPVIKDLSIEFQSGVRYGIIGETGAGKSTITKLILGIYQPKLGEIYIGSNLLNETDKAVIRSWVSYVPQSPIFPSEKIIDIISMGKPNASFEEIRSAAEKASCHFIWEKFPNGFDTIVGERGVKLSGGECQRIAIAAAILKDAPIVIMDEPTSALDAKTEKSIQDAIKENFSGKTLIVIAHRLSTVAILDEIILLGKGEIKHQGNHNELINDCVDYKEMWELQTTPVVS